MVKCEFCEKEYSEKGIGTHIWRKHGSGKTFNPNRGYHTGNRKIWNKGLTKETDNRVKAMRDTYNDRIEKGEITRSFKNKKHSEKTKQQISQTVIENIRTGKQRGWHKFKSYPELFFEDILRENNLLDTCLCQHHVSNGKRNYFLDFFFPNKQLNLELDGSQHKFRKNTDLIRDSFLNEQGIIVYRIEWNAINTKVGSTMMKNKIQKFLEYYDNMGL